MALEAAGIAEVMSLSDKALMRGCGRVWEGVGGCGRVWEGVGGCGRVWEGVGGCGKGGVFSGLKVHLSNASSKPQNWSWGGPGVMPCVMPCSLLEALQ